MPGANKFLWLDLFSPKSETEITILSTLKSNQLFSKLSQRELKYVAQVVHLRTYEPGEVVFEQYEKGLGMYIIAKGAVDIRVKARAETKADTAEVHVTTLNEGSFFGELALVDLDNKRTASAYAQGPTTLLGFFKPDLLEIMERKPQTGVSILFSLARVLGRRLQETTDLITQLRSQPSTGAPAQTPPSKKASGT